MEPPPGSERQQADQQLQAILQRSAEKQKKKGGGALRIILVVVLVLAAGAGYLLWRAGVFGGGGGDGELPGLLTTEAPWPANGEELAARLEAMGLPALTREEQALHIHPILQIRINGENIPVPANIGIDPGVTFLSALHTHDETGTLHVESAEVRDFTLGEFFDVWGVRLTTECIGGHCGPGLRARAGGQVVDDPRSIVLVDGETIVITFEG
jgi:hypothetical protein